MSLRRRASLYTDVCVCTCIYVCMYIYIIYIYIYIILYYIILYCMCVCARVYGIRYTFGCQPYTALLSGVLADLRSFAPTQRAAVEAGWRSALSMCACMYVDTRQYMFQSGGLVAPVARRVPVALVGMPVAPVAPVARSPYAARGAPVACP